MLEGLKMNFRWRRIRPGYLNHNWQPSGSDFN